MGYWFLIINYRIINYWLLKISNYCLQFGTSLSEELLLIIGNNLCKRLLFKLMPAKVPIVDS